MSYGKKITGKKSKCFRYNFQKPYSDINLIYQNQGKGVVAVGYGKNHNKIWKNILSSI